MAFLTKVRFEAEGTDPSEVMQLIDAAMNAIQDKTLGGLPLMPTRHVTDEVYERVSPDATSADGKGRYKGRRVISLTLPPSANIVQSATGSSSGGFSYRINHPQGGTA